MALSLGSTLNLWIAELFTDIRVCYRVITQVKKQMLQSSIFWDQLDGLGNGPVTIGYGNEVLPEIFAWTSLYSKTLLEIRGGE